MISSPPSPLPPPPSPHKPVVQAMVFSYVGSSYGPRMDCQIDMAVSSGLISSHGKSNYFPSASAVYQVVERLKRVIV